MSIHFTLIIAIMEIGLDPSNSVIKRLRILHRSKSHLAVICRSRSPGHCAVCQTLAAIAISAAKNKTKTPEPRSYTILTNKSQ